MIAGFQVPVDFTSAASFFERVFSELEGWRFTPQEQMRLAVSRRRYLHDLLDGALDHIEAAAARKRTA